MRGLGEGGSIRFATYPPSVARVLPMLAIIKLVISYKVLVVCSPTHQQLLISRFFYLLHFVTLLICSNESSSCVFPWYRYKSSLLTEEQLLVCMTISFILTMIINLWIKQYKGYNHIMGIALHLPQFLQKLCYVIQCPSSGIYILGGRLILLVLGTGMVLSMSSVMSVDSGITNSSP